MPVPLPPPGASGRIPAAGSSSSKSGRNVAADREALGLSSLKPSEMVAGLDQAAARAEKLHSREEQKRRGGNKMSANVALHVDETGKRWTRRIILGALGILLLGGLIVTALIYFSNRKEIPARVGNEEARRALGDLVIIVAKMKLFEEGETATVEEVKKRILAKTEEELKLLEEQIERDAENRRPRDVTAVKTRESLRKLREMKDAWGQPFEFTMIDEDTLQVKAKGRREEKADSLAPVKVRVRTVKPKKK